MKIMFLGTTEIVHCDVPLLDKCLVALTVNLSSLFSENLSKFWNFFYGGRGKEGWFSVRNFRVGGLFREYIFHFLGTF